MFVPGASDTEALARVDYYNAGADAEALQARALMYSQGAKEWSRDETLRREARRNLPDGRTLVAITRNAVIGCPDSLVDQIQDVIERGDFDWLGFYFPDYIEDLRVFGQQVLPKLVARGVGRAHSSAITL
jgi:pyrimidine oxygenase